MRRKQVSNQLKNFIRNNPLITAEPSLVAIKPEFLNNKNGSIFFGVGIVSENDISIGMPFDILAMFFVSEQLRQILNFKKVIVLIADAHAISNNKFPSEEIRQVTSDTEKILRKIIANLNLTSFRLLRGSSIVTKLDFQTILSKIPLMDNQYLRLEIADSLWLQQNENLKIKVGWTMRKDNQEIGHDERFFDQQIKKFCPSLSFVHLNPGRTFNKERPRVSPYFSVSRENRIMLKKGENATQKIAAAKLIWKDKRLGGTIKHLAAIVRAFENLFGKLPKVTLEKKIQFIINKAVE